MQSNKMDLYFILNSSPSQQPTLVPYDSSSHDTYSSSDSNDSRDRTPFTCEWQACKRQFKRNSELVRHRRTHTGERPYVCSSCGKGFIQRSALTVHLRTHTGEKPYQCQHAGCTHSFGDSSSLARHTKSHLGLRPYTCLHPGCEKAFTRRSALMKHERKHSGRTYHQFLPLAQAQVQTTDSTHKSHLIRTK
ncbi:Zinc finger, C2H2 type [Basidiobolus ranarum]|uniref:Zinc finger, C2H2 type n=1 Tax=Basidiobolus ranarum TaxID=34480 RepID=A0ABR2W1J1_9FUNG